MRDRKDVEDLSSGFKKIVLNKIADKSLREIEMRVQKLAWKIIPPRRGARLALRSLAADETAATQRCGIRNNNLAAALQNNENQENVESG
jgi:hypothetical protein